MANFGAFKGQEFGSDPGFNATAGAGMYQRGRPSGDLGTQSELPSGNLNTQQTLPSGNLNTQRTLPTGNIKWGAKFNYAAGGSVPGAIDEDADSPMMNTFGAQLDNDIRGALSVVNRVLNFGRKANGLPEVQSSDEGQAPQEGIETEGEQEMAGMLPSKPFSETPKPQPMPGPLPPTQNPFGKRQQFSEAEPEGGEEAIPTDEETA